MYYSTFVWPDNWGKIQEWKSGQNTVSGEIPDKNPSLFKKIYVNLYTI